MYHQALRLHRWIQSKIVSLISLKNTPAVSSNFKKVRVFQINLIFGDRWLFVETWPIEMQAFRPPLDFQNYWTDGAGNNFDFQKIVNIWQNFHKSGFWPNFNVNIAFFQK